MTKPPEIQCPRQIKKWQDKPEKTRKSKNCYIYIYIYVYIYYIHSLLFIVYNYIFIIGTSYIFIVMQYVCT